MSLITKNGMTKLTDSMADRLTRSLSAKQLAEVFSQDELLELRRLYIAAIQYVDCRNIARKLDRALAEYGYLGFSE